VYHRIARDSLDPWGLAVTPEHFEEQLLVLSRTRYPMHLSDFVDRFIDGTLRRDAVAVTFDDGYLDNFLAAKPLLVATGIPATVFLATSFIGQSSPFWWDELAYLILLADGPDTLELSAGSRRSRFEIGAEPPPPDLEAWRAWTPAETPRQAAYVAVWDTLRQMNADARSHALAEIRCSFSPKEGPSPSGRPLSHEEALQLASGPLMMIGAHTVTHPILTQIGQSDLSRELIDGKLACEALTNGRVSALAYPYGEYNDEVREATNAAKFTSGFCSRSKPVSDKSDVFALPRVQVPDCDGDSFEQLLCSISDVRIER
jgi:peptidoglycan/xylan/chitin deacetylase (PgdA/CDA1 family)